VAQASTFDGQKAATNIDNVIDLDDEKEPEVQSNGWHQDEHEPSPAEINHFETLDPMLATYASSAMYAPIQYGSQPILPYTAQPPLQEPPQEYGDLDSLDHVDQTPFTTTFSPPSPRLHDDTLSNLVYEAAQFVSQPNHSPSVEPSNHVSAKYPTPPPPPSTVDDEVEVLYVAKHPSSPTRQPVSSRPHRSPSPMRQVQAERKPVPKQRQASQPKRPHHRQPSAPDVNPFALLAGMDDGDEDEEEEDDEEGDGTASVAEEAEVEIDEDDEPGSEAEEEEHEFVDEQQEQPNDGQDNGYYEEDNGQYDEEHGFNDDSASGNGRYSADDDIEGDGEEGGGGEYDEELDEDESEEDDEEEEEEEAEHAPPPPSAWDGKGGSVEDAIEL